jgi:hypothetical protein
MGSGVMTSLATADLHALSDVLASAALNSNNPNDALALLRLYARLHWDNISGHFSNEQLEASIFEKWRRGLPETRQAALPEVDFLHIASQTHEQGGHSRLLQRLSVGLSKYGSQAMLLSDARKRNHVPDFPGPVERLRAKPAECAAAIIAASRNAGTILLHIHPDDSPAAFAARALRAAGKRVLFVNHADHVFSLGPGASDVVLEICMTGWKTTRDRRAARAQSFMGIPIVDENVHVREHSPPRDGPIVSIGGPGKFCPTDGLSFPDFLMNVMSQVSNDVILIGPSSKEAWWKDVTDAYPGRIHLRGFVPAGEVDEILRSASCYIDSFPLDGGTAYPQAAALGVPCFAPNAGDASGVTPTEELRFETVAALQTALVSYLNGGAYPFDLKAVQAKLSQDFSNAAVAGRVMEAVNGDLVPAPEALIQLGQRDSDYNARRWVKQNKVAVPKRLWRDLSPMMRVRLLRMVRQSTLPFSISNMINTELATRWV